MACKVLLVEDDPVARGNIANYLRTEGWQVCEVEDGESATDLLSRTPFKVVISDFYLTGLINGIDVLSRQKTLVPNGGAILITGLGSEDVKNDAVALGAVYLEKPLWLPDLLTEVRRMCA